MGGGGERGVGERQQGKKSSGSIKFVFTQTQNTSCKTWQKTTSAHQSHKNI